jgi:hypothetical protein
MPHRAGRVTKRAPGNDKKTVKESYEDAQKLVKLHDDPKYKADGKAHPIIEGVSEMTGDRIMAIVAMRMDGHSDYQIGDLLGMPQANVSKLEHDKPHAFAAAESYHLRNAARKYEINLWGVRAALSKYGVEAVDTLHKLMIDPETPHHIRRNCAVDILNLSGAGYTRQSVGGRDARIYKTQINNIAASLNDKWAGDVIEGEFEEEEGA